ncbi:MAG: PTS fructose transporter subunit IIA [Firmicutes bacterium HGW-Firmicutes-19]|jgi:N-acetylgalactosamine PTS system EIIA component|nr:MAG: PTS fructose transporter subunit IIA [Firmicutes bacterium HGW-Firmicutes-19]
MKYVVMVSHGEFAQGLRSAVRMMTGERDDMFSVSLKEDMGTNQFAEEFEKLVLTFTADDEVLLFSDILSGSPFTTSLDILNQKGLLAKSMVFTGMNMPMVLTAVLMKDNIDGEDLKEAILSEGRMAVTFFDLNAVKEEEELI